MSDSILQYKFSSLELANPDGSKPATVRNCVIGTGPMRVSNWGTFRDSFQFDGTSSVRVSTPKAEFDDKQFSIRMIFRLNEKPTGRMNIFESTALPIAIYAMPGTRSNTYWLQVSVNTKHYGWSAVNSKFESVLVVSNWTQLEVAFDLDTLFVKIGGRTKLIQAFPKGLLKPGTGSSTFIGTWVDGRRNPLKGAVAYLEVNKGISTSLESELDRMRTSPEWHIGYKYQDFIDDRNLGNPKSKVTRISEGYMRDYDHGKIIYSHQFGAFAMYGSIWALYQRLSSAKKFGLGPLVTDEIAGRRSGVRKSVFRKGAIYWSPATGAVAVLGQIYLDYENMDGELSVMGLPTQAERNITRGRYQQFQGGRMYHKTGAPKAFEVHGAILSRYLSLGGHTKAGYPLSHEMDVKNGSRTVGKVSEFESWTIYWSGSTGAFEVHGAIRANYTRIGGPTGVLGFPTSNEVNIPGTSGPKMNSFQNGSICWFGSRGTFICYPFDIRLDRVKVRDADNDIIFKDDSDIYAKITIKENDHQVHSSVRPRNGTYSNTTEANLNYTVPRRIIPNAINKRVDFAFQAWDSDDGRPWGGNDDNLGLYSKRLEASNAWGLLDNNGIYNQAGGSHSLRLDWSVRPKIPQGNTSDRDYYFWGQANRGTSNISWNTYADAFRDVTRGVNFFDHVSLKSLFYELVVKGLANGGNCFGMSLEGIYAMKCMSRFGKPLNRFSWSQIEREFNIKHQYQVGASAIWWFVGQFITGNTHDPVDVFNESNRYNSRGNKPVICIAQNYDFSGAPHCIFPWKWTKNGSNWQIECFDPNNLDGSRTIHINSRNNTFSYNNGRQYRGGEWSGGRLHYMPWYILNEAPRTPIWDVILLVLAGTILIFADSGETESLTDASGNNLNGGKMRKSDASRRSKMFIPFNGLNSSMDSNLMIQKGQAMSNNMTHKIRATKTKKFDYGIANLNGEIRYSTNFKRGELETFKTTKLGTQDNQVSILSKESKLYNLDFNQKIGEDTIRTKIENLPTGSNKDLLFSFEPGMEGVDIVSSGGSANAKIFTEVYDRNNKLKNKLQFVLPIEGAVRLRNSSVLSSGILSTSKIEKLKGSVIDLKTILPK